MRGKIIPVIIALLLAVLPATAEVYNGTTVPWRSEPADAEADGILKVLNVKAGMVVSEGDLLAATSVTSVFADEDGTVSYIEAAEGDTVDGEVMKITPVRRYTIYCTAESAYKEPENQMIRLGDTVYIRCTRDGTHRGIGIVTKLKGEEYRVQTIGGELYVGETVYIYRSDSFLTADKIGIGTVIATLEESYNATGRITKIDVEQGEFVQRGELLFSYISDRSTDITAPVSGIVTEVPVSRGDAVTFGQTVARITPFADICIEVEIPESDLGTLDLNAPVTFTLSGDSDETPHSGTILRTNGISSGENYKIYIRPAEPLQYIGLGAEVEIANK